jgi:hypothetical protein
MAAQFSGIRSPDFVDEAATWPMPWAGAVRTASRRWAGQVVDGALMCPYHGLRFDGRGAAFTIPHPGGQLPDGRLPVYPLVERHGCCGSGWAIRRRRIPR